MGKLTSFTKKQQIIIDEFSNNSFLIENFYLTGGTALSAIYLHHRESDDLDFFSEQKFDQTTISDIVIEWSKKHNFKIDLRSNERVHIFNFTFPDKTNLKVDFAYYPYKRVQKGVKTKSISVDSLFDIAINKLFTVSQRTAVKDFVDLYYLLKKFTLWDLMEGAGVKFGMKLDTLMIASDFMKASSFTFLPQMLKPLSLEQLKTFYTDLAKKIGLSIVEK